MSERRFIPCNSCGGGLAEVTVTPTGVTAMGGEFGLAELEEVTISGLPGTFWRESYQDSLGSPSSIGASSDPLPRLQSR